MKKILSTHKAPEAIGPYSQAVQAGEFVFISGQIPLNPQTGKLVEGGIKEQVHRVFQNLSAIVEVAGGTLTQVVKCSVFLKDMEDFSAMNQVYGEYFQQECPARAAVEVSRLPKDVSIEVEAVLYLGE